MSKPYEGLNPGTKQWIACWTDNPELQNEMVEYGQSLRTSRRSACAHKHMQVIKGELHCASCHKNLGSGRIHASRQAPSHATDAKQFGLFDPSSKTKTPQTEAPEPVSRPKPKKEKPKPKRVKEKPPEGFEEVNGEKIEVGGMPTRRELSPYQQFMRDTIGAGHTMKEASVKWKEYKKSL